MLELVGILAALLVAFLAGFVLGGWSFPRVVAYVLEEVVRRLVFDGRLTEPDGEALRGLMLAILRERWAIQVGSRRR